MMASTAARAELCPRQPITKEKFTGEPQLPLSGCDLHAAPGTHGGRTDLEDAGHSGLGNQRRGHGEKEARGSGSHFQINKDCRVRHKVRFR